MAQLHIYFGPMFAGKSTKLIEIYNSLLENNKISKSSKSNKSSKSSNIINSEILMINHKSDSRYSKESSIGTHDGVIMPSLPLLNLNDLFNITEIDIEKIKYILIDEGQFFNDLYDIVKLLLIKYGKTIYIGGLDGDYKQEPFTNSRMFDLIPYANTITKLTSRCSVCNETAPFTKRISDSNQKILIGGSNEYKPVCLEHL